MDLIKNEPDRAIIELLLAEQLAGRPVLMPPAVPIERVIFMREALGRMVKDKAFVEEAQKLNLDIDIVSGADISDMINRVYAISPDIVARARTMISVHE
jgi:tripartite-type tricarboxylate transporter receptor subunit TctC